MVSTDELTGVQALERKHAGLPLAPGKVERREFEYIRHGTSAFLLSRDVVTGKLVAPWCGLTRTEEDFLAHLQGVVATRPEASRWHFVLDNLNIQQSASPFQMGCTLLRPDRRASASKGGAVFSPPKPVGRPF